MAPTQAKKPAKTTTIHIDRKQYKVEGDEVTGAQLRSLPDPDIGPEFDLWREVPGGEDVKIEPDQTIKIKDGTHFFSSHSHINPGSCDAE
jgi:multiubiquitin